MSLLKGAFLATALLLASLSPAAAGAETDKAISRAKEAIAKKDYRKAIREYETALKAEPTNAKVMLLLGITYAAVGEFEKAVKLTDASIQAEPSFSG